MSKGEFLLWTFMIFTLFGVIALSAGHLIVVTIFAAIACSSMFITWLLSKNE